MIYAPVLIVTLCRFEELQRCIASLARNSYASKTELYIGVDFPVKDIHEYGYAQILQYLKNEVKGFADVHIVKQTENKGWFLNFISIRDMAYKRYERFIYLEDDVEVSSNFLEFMDKNLEYFESDDTIQAVCGYSYPFEWKEDENNIVKSNTYFTAWGYGTWKSKETEMYDAINMSNFNKAAHNVLKMASFYCASKNQFCNFIKGILEYIPVFVQNNEIVKLDMSFSVYIFMNKKYVIFPKISKTRNSGCNGKGMNCENIQLDVNKPITTRNYDYSRQPIDENVAFSLIVEGNLPFWEENNKRLEKFYPVEKKEIFRTIIAYIVYLIMGREKTKKILQRKKNV